MSGIQSILYYVKLNKSITMTGLLIVVEIQNLCGKYYDQPLIIHVTKMIFPQTRLIPLMSILLMLDVQTMIF